MALIDDIKVSLRITTTALDGEVQDIMDAARLDLVLSGVLADKAYDETDMLVKRAIVLYSKANFGLDNSDSEKYQVAYLSLKTHLTLSTEYTVAEVV